MKVLDNLYAQVIQSYPQLPTEWKSDQSHARSYAVFYESHVKKGNYKMNKGGKVSEQYLSFPPATCIHESLSLSTGYDTDSAWEPRHCTPAFGYVVQ